MTPNHENANADMIIDRVVNSLYESTKSLPTADVLERILEHVLPNDGSLHPLTLSEYLARRLLQYDRQMRLLAKLTKIPIIEQKSAEWHRVRQTIVTASDFAQALGDGKFGNQTEFIHKKSGYKEFPFDAECPPLKWGCMFEDVACAIYEKRNRIRVLPFGLLRHPSIEHFGASPDGITVLGTMVEIKCPFKRKITNEVPLQYYYQIQGQLDVCDLTECDYLECEFKKVSTLEELRGMSDAREIGCIFEYQGPTYEYSPIFSSDDAGVDSLTTWVESTKVKLGDDVIINRHIWYLDVINVIRVYKDPAFLERKYKDLKAVWDRVLAYRASRELYDAEMGGEKVKKCLDAEKSPTMKRATKSGSGGGNGFAEMSCYGFLD